MIGGIDVRFPARAGISSLEAAVRAIRRNWPDSVFENSLTGEIYTTFREVPFGKIEEIFVYQNTDAAKRWDAEGAVVDTLNTMIHLILDDDSLTVVFDREEGEMPRILSSIRSSLVDEILNTPVPRPRKAA